MIIQGTAARWRGRYSPAAWGPARRFGSASLTPSFSAIVPVLSSSRAQGLHMVSRVANTSPSVIHTGDAFTIRVSGSEEHLTHHELFDLAPRGTSSALAGVVTFVAAAPV